MLRQLSSCGMISSAKLSTVIVGRLLEPMRANPWRHVTGSRATGNIRYDDSMVQFRDHQFEDSLSIRTERR
jgi:hypothetical protein